VEHLIHFAASQEIDAYAHETKEQNSQEGRGEDG
jgi:hypothetical protein